MNYFSTNGCAQPLHSFVCYSEDIEAIHSDNSICKAAEFNIRELLDDELPTLYRCPWCDQPTLDTEHMRACSGYQTPLSREEVFDAYSDPTDAAKRERMMRDA